MRRLSIGNIILLLLSLITIVFTICLFPSFAKSEDVFFRLYSIAQDDIHTESESFGLHFEHGRVVKNGRTIGNYRISAITYMPFLPDVDIKSGEIYIEIYKRGFLFLKLMSGERNQNLLEGIISGGTGDYLNIEGTATMRLEDAFYTLVLHFLD